MSEPTGIRRLIEVFFVALRLGLTSFGGPVAHLGYFREEYVARRKWLDDAAFADLIALCQFLPGPASSQVGFAVGVHRAGVIGGLLAWLGFTAPSAIAMILFGYGVAMIGDLEGSAWLQGLKIAAVAVVVQAVWSMGVKLCPDRSRITLAIGAACVLLAIPAPWMQVGVIAVGAAVGAFFFRNGAGEATAPHQPLQHVPGKTTGAILLAVFLLLLVGLPAATKAVDSPALALFDAFYRAGSLVFGGGHVILPLLESQMVPPGWMDRETFLAGYGAAQAVPGPLFTFSAYLGTVANSPFHGWTGGVLCLGAVFLPSLFLVLGALPFWDAIRSQPGARAAINGANAAVVGVLLAALYDPVWVVGITSNIDMVIGLVLFTALHFWKVAPWLVVLAGALLAQVASQLPI